MGTWGEEKRTCSARLASSAGRVTAAAAAAVAAPVGVVVVGPSPVLPLLRLLLLLLLLPLYLSLSLALSFVRLATEFSLLSDTGPCWDIYKNFWRFRRRKSCRRCWLTTPRRYFF